MWGWCQMWRLVGGLRTCSKPLFFEWNVALAHIPRALAAPNFVVNQLQNVPTPQPGNPGCGSAGWLCRTSIRRLPGRPPGYAGCRAAKRRAPTHRPAPGHVLRTCSMSFWRLHWSAIGMSGWPGCAAWAPAHASSWGAQSPDFTPTLRASAFSGGLRRCGACP